MIELIISILVIAFLLEASLDHLNQSSAERKPDPLVAGLYDKVGRTKSINYGVERTRLGLISGAISLAILILALTYGWFADLDSAIAEIGRAHV